MKHFTISFLPTRVERVQKLFATDRGLAIFRCLANHARNRLETNIVNVITGGLFGDASNCFRTKVFGMNDGSFILGSPNDRAIPYRVIYHLATLRSDLPQWT